MVSCRFCVWLRIRPRLFYLFPTVHRVPCIRTMLREEARGEPKKYYDQLKRQLKCGYWADALTCFTTLPLYLLSANSICSFEHSQVIVISARFISNTLALIANRKAHKLFKEVKRIDTFDVGITDKFWLLISLVVEGEASYSLRVFYMRLKTSRGYKYIKYTLYLQLVDK
jgi:hypothetical protein